MKTIHGIYTANTLLILVIFCLGCTRNNQEEKFKKYLSTQNVNDKIVLSQAIPITEQPDPTEVNLWLENQSSDLIRMPIDYGIQMFVFNQDIGEWVLVRNAGTYSVSVPGMEVKDAVEHFEKAGGLPLFPQSMEKDPIMRRELVSAYPVLCGYQFPVTLRIMVVGTVFQNDQPTNEKVSAYYDVSLLSARCLDENN